MARTVPRKAFLKSEAPAALTLLPTYDISDFHKCCGGVGVHRWDCTASPVELRAPKPYVVERKPYSWAVSQAVSPSV